MSEPFIGQIQAFSFEWAPKGWAQCNGQLLSIAQNTALFSLLGTYYGGDGRVTFGLPDLRGRVPIHQGSFAGESYVMGEQGGAANVSLNSTQIPQHTHILMGANAAASSGVPGRNPGAGAALANSTLPSGTPLNFYGPLTTPQPLNPASVSTVGGNQPHDNMQPYLAINWCIAQVGLFPSRN